MGMSEMSSSWGGERERERERAHAIDSKFPKQKKKRKSGIVISPISKLE